MSYKSSTAIVIFLAIVLNSCVQEPEFLRYIDPEIYPFLVEVSENVIIEPIEYDIGFAHFEDNDRVAARCITTIKDKPKGIVFDFYTWGHLSNHQREYLLLHEIGHCSYALDHDNRLRDNGAPLSVMHRKGIDGDYIITDGQMQYYYDVAQRVFDGKSPEKTIPDWVRRKQ